MTRIKVEAIQYNKDNDLIVELEFSIYAKEDCKAKEIAKKLIDVIPDTPEEEEPN